MSGPVSPPLTVKESDSSVSVRPTTVLSFNAADFTVAGTGSEATISIDSTGTGAALTATQIGFGNASDLLTGSSKLVFLEASDCMGLGTSTPVVYSTAATTLQIHDATLPELRLTNTATGAAAGSGSLLQVAGSDFYIWNAEAAKMHFATNSQVVGTFDSAGKLGLGTQTPSYTLDAIAATDDSIARFKSNDANAGIIVDSPNDGYSVIFFAEDSTNKWSVGKLASASDTFSIYNEVTNDAVLKIQADNDMIYNDGNDAATFYMKSSNEVALDIAGSNAIGVSIALDATGTGGDEWRLVSGANSAGIGGGNFGLYNVDASTYVWTAGEDGVVGIGAFPGDSDVERLHVQGTAADANDPLVRFESTDAGTAKAPILEFYRNSASPADSDYIGAIHFSGNNVSGTKTEYGRILSQINDISAATEDAAMYFQIYEMGTPRTIMTLHKSAVVFNENQRNIDFRVESDNNPNMILVDSDVDKMGIGAAPDSTLGLLQVNVGNSTATALTLISTDADAAVSPTLDLYRNSATPLDGDDIGKITFSGRDDGGDKQTYASIFGELADVNVGTNLDARLIIQAMSAGNETWEYMRVGAQDIVFNETSQDINFRIESNGNANMLKVDGGLNLVSVGAAPVSGGATFQVPDNTISSYCNVNAVRSDGVATQTFLNEDCQGQMWVNNSATDWAFDLPESTVKGMWFKFVSTGGNITVDPNPSGGTSNTINGGTGALTRSTDNQVYTVICIDSNAWVMDSP